MYCVWMSVCVCVCACMRACVCSYERVVIAPICYISPPLFSPLPSPSSQMFLSFLLFLLCVTPQMLYVPLSLLHTFVFSSCFS
mmetsp:Transcript_22322/g.56029  ORF Transcript_22322/g.56029 Transcript_22322/m.56029 type:complete len:83 (+) Transcript_22322:161-409(+)